MQFFCSEGLPFEAMIINLQNSTILPFSQFFTSSQASLLFSDANHVLIFYMYSPRSKMCVVSTFLGSQILLFAQKYIVSRGIANTMNIKKPKRPTFQNGGGNIYMVIVYHQNIVIILFSVFATSKCCQICFFAVYGYQ